MPGVINQAGFTIGGTLAQGIVRFLVPVLVGRLAGQGDLAHVSLALSICVLLSMLWPTPAGTAASRFLASESPARKAVVERTLVRSSAIAIVALGIVAFGIGIIVAHDVAVGVSALVLTITYCAYYLVRGFFLGLGRAKRLALWESLAALAALGSTIALLLALPTGLFAAGGLVVGYVLVAIVGWPRVSLRGPVDRGVLSFTAANAAAGVASNGLVQLAMVFAYAADVPARSALFAAAFALATPASLLGQSINQVLIPHLAARPRDTEIDVRGLAKAFAVLSAALALCFGAVYALVPLVVIVIYGPGYAGAQPLMRLLVVAMWFFTIALIPAAALTAWGHTRLLAIVSASGLVVGIGAMLVLCPIIGVLGAAVGLSVGTAFMAAAITAAAWRSALLSRRSLLVPSS